MWIPRDIEPRLLRSARTRPVTVAKVGSWQWDPNTDTAILSEQLYRIAGRDPLVTTSDARFAGTKLLVNLHTTELNST